MAKKQTVLPPKAPQKAASDAGVRKPSKSGGSMKGKKC